MKAASERLACPTKPLQKQGNLWIAHWLSLKCFIHHPSPLNATQLTTSDFLQGNNKAELVTNQQVNKANFGRNWAQSGKSGKSGITGRNNHYLSADGKGKMRKQRYYLWSWGD